MEWEDHRATKKLATPQSGGPQKVRTAETETGRNKYTKEREINTFLKKVKEIHFK
jgi:hypothetical protein